MSKQMTETLWVRMPTELKERIDVQRSREGRTSLAEMIRFMCQSYCDLANQKEKIRRTQE